MGEMIHDTKRIANNTLMLYVRMFFNLIVSLYTSRLLLQALGVQDYGVYSVVGGFVSMFSMVSSSLSAASSRFLTFELGKEDNGDMRSVFATSFTIQVGLAIIVLILCESVGLWFLHNKMTIPEGRMAVAGLVFQFSVVTFLTSILIVPFNASIIAHERMGFFAYISIFEIMAKFVIVLFLAFSKASFDRLAVYAAMMMVATLVTQTICYLYCHKHFPECSFRIDFNKSRYGELLGFASWNFVGTTASVLSDQGVNMIMNVVFGPAVNAARGLSVTVSNIVNNFINNFTMAINPQITKSYAAGDLKYMNFLVFRGARFSLYMMMILAIPIELETDFLLDLWLVTVPEHTVNFVRLVLLLSFAAIFSNILGMAQMSTGKIRNYQLIIGGITILNFPLSWILMKAGAAPEVAYLINVVTVLFCMVARLIFAHRHIGLDIKAYLNQVALNVLVVTAISLALPLTLRLMMPEGWCRFLVVSSVSVIISSAAAYFIGCDRAEREFIRGYAKQIISRKQ